ncbi:MAG: lipopolysaccharide heptosyltransferase I [Acidithiobacillales bacterium]
MRILFVRLSSFGDVVFALPAARALRTARPETELAWAVEPPLASLLLGAPFVDEVLEVNTRGWRRSLAARSTRGEIRNLLKRGREFAPELIVDAQGLFKSALVTAAFSVDRKVGFGWRTATEPINCLFTNERVEADDRPHVLDRMLALAEHVTGKGGFERRPDVRHLAEREDPDVDAWLEQNADRRFALLQPFSSKAAKEWLAEELIAFAAGLVSRGLAPTIRWGPGEEARARELREHSKNLFLLAPPTTPASTARLAARAALFVGVDSGPTHLAAAAGAPTLALFGPTDPARFGPVGPRAAALRVSGADYNPERGLGVPPDAALAEIDRLLA